MHDISRNSLTQYLHFKILRTMSSLCVPNFNSALSSMPKLSAIIHFPQVNPLAPGLATWEVHTLLTGTPFSHCSSLWFKTKHAIISWLRSSTRRLAMAGDTEIHTLWSSNVLWRVSYIASVGVNNSLLCLWQEGIKCICKVQTKPKSLYFYCWSPFFNSVCLCFVIKN